MVRQRVGLLQPRRGSARAPRTPGNLRPGRRLIRPLRTLDTLTFGPGTRVLVRVDFNVPLRNGEVADDTRLRAILPTLRELQAARCRVILISHLGRPKGRDPAASLRPVAGRLESLLGSRVGFSEIAVATAPADGGVVLLENLRFQKEEEANDVVFAKALAALADVFVQDAFGTLHRAHASTTGVPAYLTSVAGRPAVAGRLVEKEVKFLGMLLESPARPYVAVLGGAKVSDKVQIVERLVERVDRLLIGGAMAYTFMKAQGMDVGSSRVDVPGVSAAKAALDAAKARGVPILLPGDHVCSLAPAGGEGRGEGTGRVITGQIPDGWSGMDIGPESRAAFTRALGDAATIFWNGPVGVFESPGFEAGTRAVADAMASATARGAVTVAGGGDTGAALHAFGLSDKISHVSTGGGASLEFLEGRDLPGLESLWAT